MGTDIHLYIERQIDGKWQSVEVDERLIPNDRNYDLFQFLADVRGGCSIEPQFPDRGIPADTSLTHWLGDHGFTYAYWDEILHAPWDEYENLKACYFRVFFDYVLHRLIFHSCVIDALDQRLLRIIIGFDS